MAKDKLNELLKEAAALFGCYPDVRLVAVSERWGFSWRASVDSWHIHMPKKQYSSGSIFFDGDTAIDAVEWLLTQCRDKANHAGKGECGRNCSHYVDISYD